MNSEAMDGDDRIDPVTGKKRRGRPPKPRPDGTLPAPKRRRVDEFGNPLPKGSNPIDPVTGEKKRGRHKKSDLPPSLPNGLGFPGKDEDSDIPSVKTPTAKLPPFSPNFARGDSDAVPGLRSPPPDTDHRLGLDNGDSDTKDFNRSEHSLPDLSGRLGSDPVSPPASPG